MGTAFAWVLWKVVWKVQPITKYKFYTVLTYKHNQIWLGDRYNVSSYVCAYWPMNIYATISPIEIDRNQYTGLSVSFFVLKFDN